MSPSPLSFTGTQAINAFADLYANAIHANQNKRYLASLRVNAVETLVVIGYDRSRALLEVNDAAWAIERADDHDRAERWSE